MNTHSLFLIGMGSMALIIFARVMTKGEKSFFLLILIALLFHLALLFFMQSDLGKFYDPNVTSSRFFNDGEAYSSNSFLISETLRGNAFNESFFDKNPGIMIVSSEVVEAARSARIIKPEAYEVGYITYFYAVIYAAYGYAPAFINFVNISANILTALMIFLIAKQHFSRICAYCASTLFLFWPTIFFYSTTKLKDPLILFICYAILYLWFNIRSPKMAIPLTLLLLVALELLRDKFSIIFIPIILAFFWLKMSPRFKIVSSLVFLPVLVIKQNIFLTLFLNCLREFANRHVGFINSGGITYSLLTRNPDYMSYGFKEWIIYFVKGWYHLIFEPLFATGSSPSFILFYPFKIIFVCLFVFSIFGVIIKLRKKKGRDFLLISFCLVFGTIFALSEANTGTMLRHRDLIAPIIFIYGTYFLSTYLSNTVGLHKSLR